MTNHIFLNISNRSNLDRFIPNRQTRNIDVAHFKLMSSDNNNETMKSDIFNLNPKQLNNYRELLQEIINYQDSPILSFKNKTNKKKNDVRSPLKIFSQWPCIPRKYSILVKPDIVLDLPNVDLGICWNIVDWGSNNHMATIWSNKVFLWRNTEILQEEVMETKIKGFGALKWNHAATKLAVGDLDSSLTVWTLPEQRALYTCSCCMTPACNISCLAWDKTDQLLVSGCTRGLLAVWGPNGCSRKCIWAHEYHRIISLAFCSSNRFLCSTATDGNVRIWLWPSCKPHVEVHYCSPVRAVAFHPWRNGLLAIGGGLGDGSITIWNANTCVQIGSMRPERNSLVDCLTWNNLTGELVTSHRLCGSNSQDLEDMETKILVLSALDKVVDCIGYHFGRVLYLMWDQTGTKLATASSDESLCIWNFFGPNTKNYKTLLRKTRISGLSKRSILSNFEKCIR